uniref:Uncharacterized protein n=1 Tax=Paramoeba aestuarina TaxID=180227 RepID=A0A7S4NE18_9EUKA|mmetsp:Transcript_14829/g.23205  ORF Transcript_14829/g.23205 Transcript_14829/m.23205 type:complete len:237 (+) Transcript_14829:169-879(+)
MGNGHDVISFESRVEGVSRDLGDNNYGSISYEITGGTGRYEGAQGWLVDYFWGYGDSPAFLIGAWGCFCVPLNKQQQPQQPQPQQVLQTQTQRLWERTHEHVRNQYNPTNSCSLAQEHALQFLNHDHLRPVFSDNVNIPTEERRREYEAERGFLPEDDEPGIWLTFGWVKDPQHCFVVLSGGGFHGTVELWTYLADNSEEDRSQQFEDAREAEDHVTLGQLVIYGFEQVRLPEHEH